jgi:hypothetical protein
MSASNWGLRRSCLAAAVVAAMGISTNAATYRFDNLGGDSLWETGQNWRESSGGTHGVIPGSADIADVSSNFTANLSTVRTVTELFVGFPNGAGTTTNGIATLNVLPGANLTNASTNGIRVGRLLKSGGIAGASKGIVNQTGGVVTVTSGTNGMRLSQGDAGTVADSLYRISDGSMRGGATNGSMTAPLQVGRRDSSFLTAEINVFGSLVDEVRFEDLRVAGSTINTGQSILHFTIDGGGVTQITAEDELRFDGTGANVLQIDMNGYAPEQDIVLVQADRITATNSAIKQFQGLPEGSTIVTNHFAYTYTWKLHYIDDSTDDGQRNSFVKLEFVSAVPEPASAGLLAVAGLAAMRRSRRSR